MYNTVNNKINQLIGVNKPLNSNTKNISIMKSINQFNTNSLYYTTDGLHNNLLYVETFVSQLRGCNVHIFENLDNELIRLYEDDFDVRYEVYLDL